MPGTEDRNPDSMMLDQMSCEEIANLMNREDLKAVRAVEKILPQVAKAVEEAAAALKSGGRLIYVGAGTSGRLGVLDASECPPTFGVPEGTVIGIIAGGEHALTHAVEGAEDDEKQGEEDLLALHPGPRDLVIGIAASGRTPYAAGALRRAKASGCKTAALVCNGERTLARIADTVLFADTGAEVLTGSTRLKAGTAQKLVLNMISTAAMVRLGKVYENLMADVQPTNAKLRSRAERIVMQATGAERSVAAEALKEAEGNPKIAIVMLLLDVSRKDAEAALQKADGHIRQAVTGRNTDEQ